MKLFTISTLALAVSPALASSLPAVPSTNSCQFPPQIPRGMKSAVAEVTGSLCRFGPTQARVLVEDFIQEKGYAGQACADQAECARRLAELADYVASKSGTPSTAFFSEDVTATVGPFNYILDAVSRDVRNINEASREESRDKTE
ncbi:hypothetical protein H4R33_006263 [Dimargaris cristalligena]|uniref:Uncharacterized protein n=1 Tax=Dimargaris cristalligena TaxID=215637 RepID=A0A4P9ZNE3_9FUNG|nr:hypothetical protein H4R33_006263 [Dimargaris cristalligena]RKP34847.1 hypothetical protein BJ085DRAFT_34344 [Dimargaris cristalligena]|eukprot:RKP34847.1 hypothetical protein BJ085DRAFT_34344 [Dimargaris cristalligena]